MINSADVDKVNKKKVIYTDSDLNDLSDFVLGKTADIPAGKDYDLNGDGKWDIYDLCLMRKELVNKLSLEYVEPDNRNGFVAFYDVVGDEVKLYRGPDESYEAVASIPKGTQISEIGFQDMKDVWFFTEYNGHLTGIESGS